jgi:hypothetical protein
MKLPHSKGRTGGCSDPRESKEDEHKYVMSHSHSITIHPSVSLPTYLRLYSPLLDLGHFFSFLIFYTVGRTRWTGDQPIARPLPTYRTSQTQNKHTQTSMLQVGFEVMIPVFLQAKTVHALRCTATVISFC